MWEYKRLEVGVDTEGSESLLNDLGGQKWELGTAV